MLSKENNKLVEVQPKVSLSNGLAWSHDESKFYYIDSFKRTIFVYDFDATSGAISNRKVLVNMDADDFFKPEELPDGMTIDVVGNLWVAMFRGKRIVNIDAKSGKIIIPSVILTGNTVLSCRLPTGKALGSIDMPTSLVTSMSFGGETLNEMYVTTCSKFLDEATRAKEPLAGYVFKVTSDDPNFRGYKPHTNLRL